MNAVLCPKTKTGIVVCAWCRKLTGTKEGIEGVTHTICPACKEIVMRTEVPLVRPTPREWLPLKEEPILHAA